MNRDWALLDAAFERVGEGLRVLGETARFVLLDKESLIGITALRRQLAELAEQLFPAQLVNSRNPQLEKITHHPSASVSYTSLWTMVRANSARTTQALRTLQEFSRIYAPSSAPVLEDMRYRLYHLEKSLLRLTPHFWLKLYFAQGIVYPLSGSVEELQHFIARGARVVQLRDKASSRGSIHKKAQALLAFINKTNQEVGERTLLIINDDPEIAARLAVAGVHIGQDYPVAKARFIIGSSKIIGRSNSTLAQMQSSLAQGADYVSLGPVFATPEKSTSTPVGLATVSAAARSILSPWVAIGGINQANFASVYEAGAKNMAMIRGAKEFFK